MARIASIVGDLMLASRVRASLEEAGHEVSQTPSLEPGVLGSVDLVVADLETVPPDELGDVGVPVIGFYQHTDVELKRRADEAGVTLAVPRSRMARELPDLVRHVLA